MSLLQEIRKQPQHIREILFGLSVVAATLVVGLFWLSSFQRDVFALLNPDLEEQRQFAERANKALPLRASIAGLITQLRASIYNFLDLEWKEDVGHDGTTPSVHVLPTAEMRIRTPSPTPASHR